MNQKKVGNKGEDLAKEFLEKKGYKIVAKNLYVRHREIDILAYDQSTLVVVEVKTTHQSEDLDLHFLISSKKRKFLTEAIDEYVLSHQLDVEVRFDVVIVQLGVTPLQITHIQEAFYA